MIKIIDGMRFNTETATKLANIGNDLDYHNFEADYTHLYRTAKGAFFIAGQSGPKGRWAVQKNDCTTGGEGLRPIDDHTASIFMEQYATAEEFEAVFGATVVDA